MCENNALTLRRQTSPQPEPEPSPITPDQLGISELFKIYHDDIKYYALFQLSNLNKYYTLINAKLDLDGFYAGTPKDADGIVNNDCIKYFIISEEKAQELLDSEDYHKIDWNNFKWKSAKLLERRSKENLYYIDRFKRLCYMIDQQVPLGDIEPYSSKFVLLSTFGEVGSFGGVPNINFYGDSNDEMEYKEKHNSKNKVYK